MKNLSLKQNKKEIEELFIEACKHKNYTRIDKINRRGKINRLLRLIGYKINFDLRYLLDINNHCRYCKDKSLDNITITKGYWYKIWSICHKSCKQIGEKEEAYECQKIDSDCNDCYYFERIKGIDGICKKFNKSVKASPNFCTSHKCFKHRLN